METTKWVWQQIPTFRIVWLFVAGIILSIFLPFPPLAFPLIVSCTIALMIWPFLPRKGREDLCGFMFPIFAMAAGYVLTLLATDANWPAHFQHRADTTVECALRLNSDPLPRARSIKAEAELIAVEHEGEFVSINGRALVYFAKSDAARTLRFGDTLQVSARFQEVPSPQNPGEFNYKRYLSFHQITHQAYLTDDHWTLVGKGRGWKRNVIEVQRGVIATLEAQGIEGDELAIVSALLVGYKHFLSADQVSAFASAGAMHVLAVSGLHVGIIYLILSGLLNWLDKWQWGKWLKAIVMILALWSYAGITGLSPSVTRAATMFTFVVFAQQFGRRTSIFNTLCASAIFLLIINPYLIVEVGFQLSYLAVFGIVLIQPLIAQWWEPKNWLLEKVWGITTVSIAAQLATFPLGLLYFHQFPNYFLVSNLVVIPAATLIIPTGILLLITAQLELLASAFGWLLYWEVHLLNAFTQMIESWPYSITLGIDISIAETYFIYLLIATGILFLVFKNWMNWIRFLTTVAVLIVLTSWESQTQKTQRALVIYNVKGATAIDIIQGRKHLFLSDSALVNDKDKMRFHIEHHWWQRDLKEPVDRLDGVEHNDHLIVSNDFSLAIVGDIAQMQIIDQLDSADLVILECSPKELIIEKNLPAGAPTFILSSVLDWRDRKDWRSKLESVQAPYHDLADHGALVKVFE